MRRWRSIDDLDLHDVRENDLEALRTVVHDRRIKALRRYLEDKGLESLALSCGDAATQESTCREILKRETLENERKRLEGQQRKLRVSPLAREEET